MEWVFRVLLLVIPIGFGWWWHRARRPRPELEIVELVPTGGGSGYVDFRLAVVNRGSKQTMASVEAWVAWESVTVSPASREMLVNEPPARLHIRVSRPRLGDLVAGIPDATTLYGERLVVKVTPAEGKAITKSWSEEIPDPVTDRARHEALMRAWRAGRGEETSDDLREAFVAEHERHRDDRP